MKKNCFIGGQWVEASVYAPLYSPYSGEEIAQIPQADPETVQKAIDAAEEAAAVMRRMPAYQRAAILEKMSLLMDERLEEAARIIALEAGKPIKTARGEVIRTIQTYKFAAEEAKRIHGETLPLDAAIWRRRQARLHRSRATGRDRGDYSFQLPDESGCPQSRPSACRRTCGRLEARLPDPGGLAFSLARSLNRQVP